MTSLHPQTKRNTWWRRSWTGGSSRAEWSTILNGRVFQSKCRLISFLLRFFFFCCRYRAGMSTLFLTYFQTHEPTYFALADLSFLANTTRGSRRKISTVQISSPNLWRRTKRAAAVRALQAVGPNHPARLQLAPKTLAARGETRTKKRKAAANRSGKKRWLLLAHVWVADCGMVFQGQRSWKEKYSTEAQFNRPVSQNEIHDLVLRKY